MCGETVNNIIEYTPNPKNRHLSSGGSSGGEGALISLKGSPLGFGTDIGGSIRIPAAFNGLYGIRPSSGRLPYEGMANSMDGQNTILSVVGPLSSSLGGLKLAVKSLLYKEPWLYDPLVIDMPWREEKEVVAGEKLTFAVMKSDGVVGCHPPMNRAIDIVVSAALKLGHEVIEWSPPSHAKNSEIAVCSFPFLSRAILLPLASTQTYKINTHTLHKLKTWHFDGGRNVHDAFALSNEPMSPQMAATYPVLREEFTATQIAEVNVEKRKYQKEYMDYWNSTAKVSASGRVVDAVICATAPYVAPRIGRYDYYGTSIFRFF